MLELALREAHDLGHTYVGTEHILLGLMREGDGVGAQILVGSGIEFASVRHHIRQLMHERSEDDLRPAEGPGPSGPAEQPGPSGQPGLSGQRGPSREDTDDLTARLASVAARLTVIEQRLRESAP